MFEYIQCRKCKPKQSKTSPAGYYKDIEIKNGIEYSVVKECSCHVEWRIKEERFKKFIKNGFNKDFFNINMNKSYIGTKSIGNISRLNNYIEKFNNNIKVKSSILYFYGQPDTQKEETFNWIASNLIEPNNIKYVTFISFFDDTQKAAFMSAEYPESQERVIIYENCDLLIIDEVDDRDISENQFQYLEKIFHRRMSNNLGIIFVSELPIEKLKNKIFIKFLEKECKKNNFEFLFNDIKNDIPEVLF